MEEAASGDSEGKGGGPAMARTSQTTENRRQRMVEAWVGKVGDRARESPWP